MLGFLYADGSVNQFRFGKYRILSVGLSEKDRDYLQMIVDIFNQNYNKNYVIKEYIKNKSCKFVFCLCKPIQQLISLGIHHNKTYENDDFIFLNVPDEFKRHFVRGYFDGDGSIGIYHGKATIGFVSLNNKLLSTMLDYFHSIGFRGTIRMDGKYTRLYFSGNPSCKNFLDWLYHDANIYMSRKYQMYQQIP